MRELNPELENKMAKSTDGTGVVATVEGTDLVIRIPMNAKPETSKSGKTLVVASSHGNLETNVEVNGKKVTIGVNAYIKK